MTDLKGMTPAEIDRFCSDTLGQRPGQGLRAAVLLFRNRVEDMDTMTSLNRAFRAGLKERCVISTLVAERAETSEDGTTKLLFRLADGNAIESVLIPGPGRLTLCVSSQVGCASGCGFCRTGSGGLVRNLTTPEIVNQVFAAGKQAGIDPVTNIVLMGMGEPLANYENVKRFIRIATDHEGLGYSGRKVLVSTCGLVPQIEQLAEDGVDASLAVSLNATTDEVRDRLMPVNRAWPLGRLLQALRSYAGKTGRTVTIEYVLFKKVNDSPEDARRLAGLLDGLPCMVNLLPFNPFPGSAYERPEQEHVFVFRDLLVRSGLVAVVRQSRGRDINAACGQLRAAAPSP